MSSKKYPAAAMYAPFNSPCAAMAQNTPEKKSTRSKIRILQRKVVYVIGLSFIMANSKILSKFEYFGQYGKISKIIINKSGYSKKDTDDMTYSAYITYESEKEAALAILVIDNVILDNKLLKASFGTTKYCNYFLNGIECTNKDCVYQHFYANEEDILLKNETNSNNNFFRNQYKMACECCDIFNPDKKNNFIKNGELTQSIFDKLNIIHHLPTVDTIYQKSIIKDLDFEYNNSGGMFVSQKKRSVYDLENFYSKNNNYLSYFNKESKSQNISEYFKDNFDSCEDNFDYQIYDNSNDEEDTEYILVKEHSHRRKKFLKTEEKKKYKAKKKYNLDDFQKKISKKKVYVDLATEKNNNINNNIINDLIEKSDKKTDNVNNNKNNNETININSVLKSNKNLLYSDASTSASSGALSFQPKKTNNKITLFKSAVKSRFNFVDEKKEIIIIPEYIKDILYKKLITISLFGINENTKKLDEIIFGNDIAKIEKWN